MYKENSAELLKEIEVIDKKIAEMSSFIKYGDYHLMDKTQQLFFDRQLESVKDVKKWTKSRLEHFMFTMTSNRRK